MAVAEREEENPLVEGLERLPVPGTTLVIFGATGDLARRKLLPAIYNLAHEGALPERFNLIGVSRRDQSDDEFRDFARESIKEFSRREADDTVLDGLLERLSYIGFSFDDQEGYGKLSKALDGARGGGPPAQPRLLPLDRARVLRRDHDRAQGGEAQLPPASATCG